MTEHPKRGEVKAYALSAYKIKRAEICQIRIADALQKEPFDSAKVAVLSMVATLCLQESRGNHEDAMVLAGYSLEYVRTVIMQHAAEQGKMQVPSTETRQ